MQRMIAARFEDNDSRAFAYYFGRRRKQHTLLNVASSLKELATTCTMASKADGNKQQEHGLLRELCKKEAVHKDARPISRLLASLPKWKFTKLLPIMPSDWSICSSSCDSWCTNGF